MATTSNNPPIFTEENKFDGTNWIGWSNTITIATHLHGAHGYLEGTINKPTTVNINTIAQPNVQDTLLPPEPTPWTSRTPSKDEWEICDAWMMGLLIYNIKNPVSLGVQMEGTATEVWKSLTDQYNVTSKLALVNAQCKLCMTILSEGGDLLAHISDLHTKRMKANTAGAKIEDTNFHMIILSSLPTSYKSCCNII